MTVTYVSEPGAGGCPEVGSTRALGTLTCVSGMGAMVAAGNYDGVKSGSLQREQSLLECVEPALDAYRIRLAQDGGLHRIRDLVGRGRLWEGERAGKLRRQREASACSRIRSKLTQDVAQTRVEDECAVGKPTIRGFVVD